MGTLRGALVKAGLISEKDATRREREHEKRRRDHANWKRKTNQAIESQSPSIAKNTSPKLTPNDPTCPERYYSASYR